MSKKQHDLDASSLLVDGKSAHDLVYAVIGNVWAAIDAYQMLNLLFHEEKETKGFSEPDCSLPYMVQHVLYPSLQSQLIISISRVYDSISMRENQNASLRRLVLYVDRHMASNSKSHSACQAERVKLRMRDLASKFHKTVGVWRGKVLAHSDLLYAIDEEAKLPELDIINLWEFLCETESFIKHLSVLSGAGSIDRGGDYGTEAAYILLGLVKRDRIYKAVGHYLRKSGIESSKVATEMIRSPAHWDNNPKILSIIERSLKSKQV